MPAEPSAADVGRDHLPQEQGGLFRARGALLAGSRAHEADLLEVRNPALERVLVRLPVLPVLPGCWVLRTAQPHTGLQLGTWLFVDCRPSLGVHELGVGFGSFDVCACVRLQVIFFSIPPPLSKTSISS